MQRAVVKALLSADRHLLGIASFNSSFGGSFLLLFLGRPLARGSAEQVLQISHTMINHTAHIQR